MSRENQGKINVKMRKSIDIRTRCIFGLDFTERTRQIDCGQRFRASNESVIRQGRFLSQTKHFDLSLALSLERAALLRDYTSFRELLLLLLLLRVCVPVFALV